MAKIIYSDCFLFKDIFSNKGELVTRKAWKNNKTKPFAILLDDVILNEYCAYSEESSLQYLKNESAKINHSFYSLEREDEDADDWMFLSLKSDGDDIIPSMPLEGEYVAIPRWDLNKVFSVLDFKGLSLYDEVIGATTVSKLKTFVQNFYSSKEKIPHGKLVGITEKGFYLDNYNYGGDKYPCTFIYKLDN